MKANKNILNKLLISFILSMFIVILTGSIYGYGIEHIVMTKDKLYDPNDSENEGLQAPLDFPEQIFKNQVKAHPTTSSNYDSGIYTIDNATGWAYTSQNRNKDVHTGQLAWNEDHTKAGTFSTVYYYFHKYQNTVYDNTKNEGERTLIHSVGQLWPKQTAIKVNMLSSKVYGVSEENSEDDSLDGKYTGFYWQAASPAMNNTGLILKSNDIRNYTDFFNVDLEGIKDYNNVVIMPAIDTVYRFAVKDKIYIADSIISSDVVKQLWEKFRTDSSDSSLKVYCSTVNRVDVDNILDGSRNINTIKEKKQYWSNIDTAYKFWESTIRSGTGWADGWNLSETISGGSNGAGSIINYYDNIFTFTKGKVKTVYVRHINASTNELITGINNSQALEVRNSKVNGKYIYVNKKWPNDLREQTLGNEKYNEVYTINPTDNNYIIGNIKYNNTGSYVQYVNGVYNSIAVKSLNYANITDLSQIEQNILNNYDCTGMRVGTGDTLERAVIKRNNSTIIDAGSYTYKEISGIQEQENYIVIDFYYKPKTTVQPKQVYVRHIDQDTGKIITGINNSQALEVESTFTKDNKYMYLSAKFPNGLREQNYEGETYNETYTINVSNKDYIISNIKYDNTGDYVNSLGEIVNVKGLNYSNISHLTENEKKILNNYDCVGKKVGRGINISDAKTNRNNQTLASNGKYTYETISGTNERNNIIVIDFYYKKSRIVEEKRNVYVRHIDLTGKTVNNSNVTNAISQNKVLSGTGQAQVIGSDTKIGSVSVDKNGYQEKYQMSSGTELKISKSNQNNYVCIGSNIIGSSTDFANAESRMASRLNSRLYNSSKNDKEYVLTTNVDASNYYIIIDFYYKSSVNTKIIDRNPIGRLAFYTLDSVSNSATLSGDDSTYGDVNNKVNNNYNNIVYDIIPSGETLKMSIDNAPTYMLGGINIQEQKITETGRFTFTVYQPYKVEYLDWSSTCNTCGETYTYKKEGVCNRASYHTLITCNPSGCTDNSYWEYCKGWCTPTSKIISTNGRIAKTYTYTIPYEYTFYKVKNMRLYTISKIELYDNYKNNGLPLFDGNVHTIYPKTEYIKSFVDKNSSTTGSNFINSESNQYLIKWDTDSETNFINLETELLFYHDNQHGDVSASTASATAINNISNMLNTVDNSEAAQITDLITTPASYSSGRVTSYTASNSIKKCAKSERLRAKFYVKNDEVSFVDGIRTSSNKITLVGEENENATDNNIYNKTNVTTERRAVTFVDLTTYTGNKIEVATKYPSSIRGTYTKANGSKYLPTAPNQITTDDYFNEETLNIPTTRLNGKRYSYGKIYYNILENSNASENQDLNFDVNGSPLSTCSESNKSNCHNWSRTGISGIGTTEFNDTEMYSDKDTVINSSTINEIEWEYGENNNSNKDADIVDVFTPISFTTSVLTGTGVDKQVDHTTINTNSSTYQIQKNAKFTIQMKPTSANTQYDNLSTSKYLMQYYIKFDFDVQDIVIYDAKNELGRDYEVGAVAAGDWIGPIYNHWNGKNLNKEAKISAYALADPENAGNVVNQESNNYTVRAVVYNSPSKLLDDLVKKKLENPITNATFIHETFNNYDNNTSQSHSDYYEQKNIYGHNMYIAEKSIDTQNLSRVYDFKVTDLKDLDWKDIFRISTATNTNKHTSKAYYSGIKKWNIYTTKSNDIISRTVDEIGATNQQILPVGPYKNVNTTYVKAPKLGYKFSFDLKTTGANENKKIVITPKFYYISKEVENDRPKEIVKDIELYYKNNSGKYVSVKNYNQYFVPDDGYRLTFEGTDAAYRFEPEGSSLSKTTIKLGTAEGLILTNKMQEKADNMFVQIWYGEYKLPNSTIAVKENGNINSKEDRLTNGYIAIKFEIEVREYASSSMRDGTEKRILKYNQKDNNANAGCDNTTQWDYEGYLGYNYETKRGTDITLNDNIRIPLEGGVWKLNQEDYDLVKGTVILYDTDAKASSDYD